MRILSRYLLASYLALFALALFLSLLLMTVMEMLVNFDEIVEHREAAGGALQYLLLRVPALYLREVVPVASFLAAFLCLGLAARAREVIAIKTGGISPQRAAAPLLLAAAVLSGLSLLSNETLLLGVAREFTRFENPDSPIVFRRGSFWYHRGNTFYNVREFDRDAGVLRGVRVFALDAKGRLVQTVRAEEVAVGEGQRWHFVNATLRRYDPATPWAPPAVERRERVSMDVASERDLALLDLSENTLSIRQLLDAIGRRRAEDRGALRYRARLHSRLAEPAAVWVFALLGVPIGLGVERTRSVAVSALYGLAALAGFRIAWQVSELLARAGFDAAAFGPWIVIAGFSGLGLWLYARAPR